MKKGFYILFLLACPLLAEAQSIYHKGWIDFNKNGRKDIYEDPSRPVNERVADVLRVKFFLGL